MNTLKQCLHLDPDSKPCLTAHRMVKSFDKSFTKLSDLLQAENWKGVIQLLTASGKTNDFAKRFDEAMEANTSREQLLLNSPAITLPDPATYSPRRQDIVRALCRSYVHLNDARTGAKWCEMLLKMDGAAEDVDGLVGKGEALLLDEEWEEGVRMLERAFEASGRTNRDVSPHYLCLWKV